MPKRRKKNPKKPSLLKNGLPRNKPMPRPTPGIIAFLASKGLTAKDMAVALERSENAVRIWACVQKVKGLPRLPRPTIYKRWSKRPKAKDWNAWRARGDNAAKERERMRVYREKVKAEREIKRIAQI